MHAILHRIVSAAGAPEAGIVIAAVREGLANTLIIYLELASRAVEILESQKANRSAS